MKCFEGNISIFNIFGREYDSKLRNATHHKWLKYNDSSQIITYPISGASSEKTTLFYAFEKIGVRQNPWKPTEMLFWLTNLLAIFPEYFSN